MNVQILLWNPLLEAKKFLRSKYGHRFGFHREDLCILHQNFQRFSYACGFNYVLDCDKVEEMQTKSAGFWDETLVTVTGPDGQQGQEFKCVVDNTTCCWDDRDSLKDNRYKYTAERENLIKQVSENTGLEEDNVVLSTFF